MYGYLRWNSNRETKAWNYLDAGDLDVADFAFGDDCFWKGIHIRYAKSVIGKTLRLFLRPLGYLVMDFWQYLIFVLDCFTFLHDKFYPIRAS